MSMLEQRDEQQIITSVLAGDVQLFHELIRPYERSVYAMAFSLLRNEADAEDAAQEAFLSAFHHLSSFRGEAKFGTWLISIVLNEARGRLRRANAVRMESLDDNPEDNRRISPALLRDWREIPLEALERHEVKLILQEAITCLPQIYREIFVLRDIDQLSTTEAATVLQISVSATKVRLHRARLMLQKDLAPKLKQLNPKRRLFQWL